MSHYFLSYELASDYLDRRQQFRDAHLRLAWQQAEEGSLVVGGAVGEPISSALLLFTDADAAAEFANADPYVQNGLVRSWRVDPWHTVVGQSAAKPVRPA